ncbi:MAG: hypothetical protein ACR2QC_04115 [Gammaproteobacteria bacterium]
MSEIQKKSAAEVLDLAIRYENDGKPGMADKALNLAISRDLAEHAENPAMASLPRHNKN